MSELLNEIETARRLRLHPGTLAVWRCRNRGPAFVRVGRRVFYRVEDIEGFINAGRQAPARSILGPTAETET